MEEGIEGQGEQDDNIYTQHHGTQLQLFPVDDVQNWKGESSGRSSEGCVGREGRGGGRQRRGVR